MNQSILNGSRLMFDGLDGRGVGAAALGPGLEPSRGPEAHEQFVF